jgi:hypothetical protein
MLITETMNEQRRFGFRYFRSYGVKFEESCILASIQEKDGTAAGVAPTAMTCSLLSFRLTRGPSAASGDNPLARLAKFA